MRFTLKGISGIRLKASRSSPLRAGPIGPRRSGLLASRKQPLENAGTAGAAIPGAAFDLDGGRSGRGWGPRSGPIHPSARKGNPRDFGRGGF